jgi:hypothetical protein
MRYVSRSDLVKKSGIARGHPATGAFYYIFEFESSLGGVILFDEFRNKFFSMKLALQFFFELD